MGRSGFDLPSYVDKAFTKLAANVEPTARNGSDDAFAMQDSTIWAHL